MLNCFKWLISLFSTILLASFPSHEMDRPGGQSLALCSGGSRSSGSSDALSVGRSEEDRGGGEWSMLKCKMEEVGTGGGGTGGAWGDDTLGAVVVAMVDGAVDAPVVAAGRREKQRAQEKALWQPCASSTSC